jgi:hypothetical protein
VESTELIAVCGLYCGACEMYRADHDNNKQKLKTLAQSFADREGEQFTEDDIRCDGCLGKGYLTPWCSKCQIRLCSKLQSGKVRCSDCEDFPCARISDFCNDGLAHHVVVLENLGRIREVGIENWVAHEKERWTCPKCKVLLSWYDAFCPSCGASRSNCLFPVKNS